jgi:hypothetical protein
MITILRSDAYAIHLTFDANDINGLLAAAQSAIVGQAASVIAEYSESVVSPSQAGVRTLTCRFEMASGDRCTLVVLEDVVRIELISDALDVITKRLLECQTGGDFFPSEVCAIEVSGLHDQDLLFLYNYASRSDSE